MEPNNNLENQFRDKLNAREIQPSPMAWDRLDAMLTVAENKKPKRKWNWLLIAASFVGILFAGFAVYELQSTKIDTNNGIVIQDTVNSNQNNNDNQKSNKNIRVHTICSGLLYGNGEANNVFYEFFRRAWLSLH